MLAHARHLHACDVGAEVNREDPRYFERGHHGRGRLGESRALFRASRRGDVGRERSNGADRRDAIARQYAPRPSCGGL